MMEWLEDFLANKLLAPILLALLILVSVGLGIQTVRINGISLFGWYAVNGYKPLYEADERDMAPLRSSVGNLKTGLLVCNASVDGLHKASEALNKATQALVDQRLREAADFENRIRAVNAIKSSGAKCPTVDHIFETGFK